MPALAHSSQPSQLTSTPPARPLAPRLYAVSKALRCRVSFSSITRAMLAALPDHPSDLFDARVEIQPAPPPAEAQAAAEAGGGGGKADKAAAMAAVAAAARTAPGGAAGASGGSSAVLGDIRTFYNSVFLPQAEGGCKWCAGVA